MRRDKEYSVQEYLLIALIPYSKPNMQLAFKPRTFFNELERISKANRRTMYRAMASAQKNGLDERAKGIPLLTKAGEEFGQPLIAKILDKDVSLMVIFDIPEELSYKRRQFRTLLQRLDFEQTQKSVWTSRYDHSDTVKTAISALEIEEFVQIFECAKIK